MTECYVCLESCTTSAPCLCKNLYLHPNCQMIMRVYEQNHCGICKTPYEQEKQITKIKTRYVVLCNLVSAVLLLLVFHLFNGQPFSLEYDSVPFLVFFCFSFWCSGFAQTLQQRQNNLNPPQYRGPMV